MYVAPHHSIDELKLLIKQHHCSDFRQRLHIVLLGKEGRTFTDVAKKSGFARSSCIEWIGRYNRHSLKGLENCKAPGKPKALTPEEEARFRRRIELGPTPEDKICAFHGEDVREILNREFGKMRSLAAVYNLLHSLGYSCLCPRPKHPKGDSERQEAFKKKLKKSSKRRRLSILGKK